MRSLSPLHLILIGLFLLILGFVLPLLMILQVLKSTFLLNFIAYACSFLGLMLGLIGSISLVSRRKK